MKLFSFLTVFSIIFLNRFGLNVIPDFSLSFSYVFIYAGLLFALIKNNLTLNISSFYLFTLSCFLSCISFLNGEQSKSFASLCLFLFVYFPFIFQGRSRNNAERNFFLIFFPFLIVIAGFGFLQFFLQFLFSADWLFDYRPFIPDFFRNKNPMNTVIHFGGVIKSNGFFLLEPSTFSQFMAFGMYLVCISVSPIFLFFVFFTGLFISFSGTGLILFFISSILSFFYSGLLKKYISFVFFVLFIFIGFLYKDTSVLMRLSEFSAGTQLETSSAAARFINPFYVLKDSFFQSPKTFLFGQGPGTITRSQKDFQAHDPAWAKLFYEYGFFGGFLFLGFIFFSVNKDHARFDISFLFFVQWFFLGGHLLSFDTVALYIVYYKLSHYD